MAEEAKKPSAGAAILGLILAGGFAWYFLGGGLQSGVAKDYEDQYNMAKISGTKIDLCVRAGLVAEGYLQAKDQSNYAKWKRIQKSDCDAAGLKMP
jgi:hypothetical protein